MDRSSVYVLRIESAGLLESAFARVMSTPDVESCIIEPDHLEIRFTSPEVPARQLLDRVYLEGGLVWCSRHALTVDPPAP